METVGYEGSGSEIDRNLQADSVHEDVDSVLMGPGGICILNNGYCFLKRFVVLSIIKRLVAL